MFTKRIFWALVILVPVLAVMLWPVRPDSAQAANNAVQVVFSTQVNQVFNYSASPPPDPHFGFWIWCQGAPSPPSSGSYVAACDGSMYFYGLALVRPVAGIVSKVADEYTMSVVSKDNVIACKLTNKPPVTSGPTNEVDVSCTDPSGSAKTTGIVVVVTGP